MQPSPNIKLDSEAVKVLAHPLRSRILSQLRLHGPATATELAATLGTNSGVTSYHLRTLEKVGLVTDTGQGIGKKRFWIASSHSHSWINSQFADDEDAQAALEWLRRDYVRQFAVRAEDWLGAEGKWPTIWVDLLGLSDTQLLVTPDQLSAFQAEFEALTAKYQFAGKGDAEAQKVHVAIQLLPVDLEPPSDS